jgi:hypothetical protein
VKEVVNNLAAVQEREGKKEEKVDNTERAH